MRKLRCFLALLALAQPLVQSLVQPALAHEGYGNRTLPRQRSSQPDAQEAPPEFDLSAPGVCRLYHLSGYFALDAAGEVVPLHGYCREQQNWAWHGPGEFWEAFREAASAETLGYAQSLDRDKIEAYAQAICPFLQSGATLQDLSQIQTSQQFPADFEQAVTIAAVQTYCPDYRSALAE